MNASSVNAAGAPPAGTAGFKRQCCLNCCYMKRCMQCSLTAEPEREFKTCFFYWPK